MIKSLLSRKLGELRVTRTDLSRATGIRLNTISALYNDALDRVSMDQLDKICEALDCDLSEIPVSYTHLLEKPFRSLFSSTNILLIDSRL